SAPTTLEAERKHVTVLFADMKASMQLLAGRDPEEARRLLDPVLERMMEAVRHYEGTVNQVMGDGIMALFGAPLAQEDHAVRACFAALRMQELVRQYSEQTRDKHRVTVPLQVGLDSGEVVVRAIGPVSVKGVANAIDVYEVTGAGPARTRLQAAARRGLTRFVGREVELGQLESARRLARASHGQVV